MTDLLCTAYVGPGAGFAFVGSLTILLTALGMVFMAVVTWPARLLFGWLFRKGKKRAASTFKRVVVVGLDGMDYHRTKHLLAADRLPNLQALADTGCFQPLWSTCPPISPAAWSSFMTGVNPGKHRIYDFLRRDPKTYLPELSSARLASAGRGKKHTENLRRSKPFWHVLSEYGLTSTLLRIPITYPAEPFNGRLLSGLCLPDLKGTQGAYTLIAETKPDGVPDERFLESRFQSGKSDLTIELHEAGGRFMARCDLRLIRTKRGKLRITNGSRTIELTPDLYSPWYRLKFRRGWKSFSGIVKFRILNLRPLKLYMTPIQIDPERPAMPISHPVYYSVYLAKLLGPFATLGLAEDTNALNDGVLDDEMFIEQVYDIHAERESMFFNALKRTRRGVCACVFDATDRMQHMFIRKSRSGESFDEEAEEVLEDLYKRVDDMIGRIRKKLRRRDLLIVLSDHGFTAFHTGIDLNAWLRENGYLCRLPEAAASDSLRDVDWSKTRAYTFGLSGVYLNRKGRESQGIVDGDSLMALKKELTQRLLDLRDPDSGRRVIEHVYDTAAIYRGPYRDDGPDLIIGYAEGYRAAWSAANGRTDGEIFLENNKLWRGDHCVDYRLVPGVLFMNRRADTGHETFLMDMAPTILQALGAPPPEYMDGTSLHVE